MVVLSPLEAAVLQQHCNQLGPADAAALRAQVSNVSVLCRENTGAGFFTYFSIERDSAPQIRSDTRDCCGEGEMAGKFAAWFVVIMGLILAAFALAKYKIAQHGRRPPHSK